MKQKLTYLNSNTIPLQYWWNIGDTNNYIWLVKDADHSEEDKSEESIEQYNLISNTILNKYGVSSSHLSILKKRRKYLILMCDGLNKEDNHKIWRAGLVKKEIDKLMKGESEGKREDSLILIGKFVYGNPISAMNITLNDYHANMNYANRTIAAENRLNKANNG